MEEEEEEEEITIIKSNYEPELGVMKLHRFSSVEPWAPSAVEDSVNEAIFASNFPDLVLP